MADSTRTITLLEAARTVARGGQLDAKLGALAEQAASLAGGRAAIVYLLDPLHARLIPAAQAGLGEAALADDRALHLEDADELVARVVRERRAATADAREVRSLQTAGHVGGTVACLPLVVADEDGGEDAEGALLALFDGPAPDPHEPDEPLTALADLCAVAIRTARLEHALTERVEWLERLGSTDSLTGLANRSTLVNMLELEIARARRQGTALGMVVFDVDGLTEINERAGADVGDEILRRVASTVADQVRIIDTAGRIGRDEFAVIAPGGDGQALARRVVEAAGSLEISGERVSLSAGTAMLSGKGRSGEELLNAAMAALDEARRRGRGEIAAASDS